MSPHISSKDRLTGWWMKEDLFESWFGTRRKRSKFLFILRLGKMSLFVTSPLKVFSCLHNFAEGWVCRKQMLTSVPQVVFCELSKLRKQRCCQKEGFTSPLHLSCGLPLVLSWQHQNLGSHWRVGARLDILGLAVPGLEGGRMWGQEVTGGRIWTSLKWARSSSCSADGSDQTTSGLCHRKTLFWLFPFI